MKLGDLICFKGNPALYSFEGRLRPLDRYLYMIGSIDEKRSYVFEVSFNYFHINAKKADNDDIVRYLDAMLGEWLDDES